MINQTRTINIPLWLFNLMPRFILALFLAGRFVWYFTSILRDKERTTIRPGDRFQFVHEINIQYPGSGGLREKAYVKISYT